MTWKSCASKARFTEHKASRVAARFGQRAYYCSECTGYHCTKSEERGGPAPFRRTLDPKLVLTGTIERAKKALSELKKKGVTGPLLDTAELHLKELKASRKAG